MTTQTETCSVCGAIIDSAYTSKHRRFHRETKEAVEEIQRVKRSIR